MLITQHITVFLSCWSGTFCRQTACNPLVNNNIPPPLSPFVLQFRSSRTTSRSTFLNYVPIPKAVSRCILRTCLSPGEKDGYNEKKTEQQLFLKPWKAVHSLLQNCPGEGCWEYRLEGVQLMVHRSEINWEVQPMGRLIGWNCWSRRCVAHVHDAPGDGVAAWEVQTKSAPRILVFPVFVYDIAVLEPRCVVLKGNGSVLHLTRNCFFFWKKKTCKNTW